MKLNSSAITNKYCVKEKMTLIPVWEVGSLLLAVDTNIPCVKYVGFIRISSRLLTGLILLEYILTCDKE